MLIGYTTSIDAYRARTDTMTPTVLRRKRCACGRQVTAKQLVQHGRCDTCVQAQTLMNRKAGA